MLESIIQTLSELPPAGIFIVTFLVAYIENLFPPSPSDLVLVFIGTLVGIGTVAFLPTAVAATFGSVAGFATAYWIGRKYGRTIIEKGWVPFITISLLEKVYRWFEKYHGLIIIGNRFLAGTRAVISFAAGITRLPFPRTAFYSALGAFAWNSLLIWMGMQVGTRWREIDKILSAYGWVATGLIVTIMIIFIIRKRRRRSVS
ncbi:MAG: DedA family protein [Ignavibacteria bacterium]|nr:DedA family protein [Ignavibacteria bacterium]